jgi:hypothetical protein
MDRVTVVTVPPPGADRSLLWSRFATATSLPDLEYAFPARDNSSLGVAEAELLRRLNPRLREPLDWPAYEALIKRRFAEGVLGPLDSMGRLRLPPSWSDEVSEICAAEVEFLKTAGITLVGDLDDLVPAPYPDDEPVRQPADLSDAELLDTALEVLARLAARPANPVPTRLETTLRRIREALPRRLRDRLYRPDPH